jgi:hypothetical protein
MRGFSLDRLGQLLEAGVIGFGILWVLIIAAG